jgi:carbamoyltransferase
LLGKPRTSKKQDSLQGSFLGPAFTKEDIGIFLDSVGARYEYIEDEPILLERVAQLLDQEKVIGWFHGRMEFGPRALGARSIIGDARSPFAPCVLYDHVDNVFEMHPDMVSPYMLFVASVRDAWRLSLSPDDKKRMQDPDLRVRVSVPRSRVPAITHVDYSARIQTVDPERHGRFYRLMRRFYELTDCPIIVNTSFNIRGEPIVCTPVDAFRCFMGTDIDCLVLDDHILLKDEQPTGLLQNGDVYKTQFTLD